MAPSAPPKEVSRVSRPVARYRPGKAPQGAGASLDDYSDSDASDGAHDDGHDAGDGVADLASGTATLLNTVGQQQRRTAGVIVNEAGPSKKLDLRLNSISQTVEQEDDSSEYETDPDDETIAAPKPVFRKPGTSATQQTAPASDSSEYETDSEDDSASDEPAPQPMLKPLFVPKGARTTLTSTTAETTSEADAEAAASALASARRKEAHDLAARTIQRSLAEQQHQQTLTTDVDDTDGVDPDAEFQAWRSRELARLQRDRDAMLAAQREQTELAAFRALPEAEKERLGRERAAQVAAEKKEQRGNPAFMQKYYHKGSFFQDMDILKRDYTEATTKDVDVSKLPKMMQVRNYGVKSRSKWTHLANEDTSKAQLKVGGSGCFRCGGGHLRKDCPEASGANSVPDGEGRSWGKRESREQREKSRSPRRERSTSPRRERSTSPRRERSKSPRRSSRDTDDRPSSRYDDKSQRSHHSRRDDRERTDHSSSHPHRDRDRTHRSHRDEDNRDRSHRNQDRKDRSHRHHRDSDHDHRSQYIRSDRHRTDESQGKRQDRDEHRTRDYDSDRNRSRH